jgi:hypothetical protein
MTVILSANMAIQPVASACFRLKPGGSGCERS